MTELPNGWATAVLGEVAEWSSGGTPRAGTAAYYGGDIPWAVIGDLNDGRVSLTASTITPLGLQNSSAKIVDKGTVPELFRHAEMRTHVRVGFAAATAGAADAIAGLAGAGNVTASGGGTVFDVVQTADGLAARVGALAASRGWVLTELAPREPSIEDLFLALTQRSGGHIHAQAGTLTPGTATPGTPTTGAAA